MKKLVMLLATLFCALEYAQEKPWTWRYLQTFETTHKNSCLTFQKKQIPAFDQLILSWNGIKPEVGHYRVSVAVQTASGGWSPWYHYADWGKKKQQTFMQKSNHGINHLYVRLEIPQQKKARGFRVKIEAYNKAPHVNITSIQVTTCVKEALVTESQAPYLKNLKPIRPLRVPPRSQMIETFDDHRRICSPTSLSMVVSYWTKENICPPEFAYFVYDKGLETYGSWPFNVAHVFSHTNGEMQCHVTRGNSFMDIYDELQAGRPVCVSIRGPLKGQAEAYQYGHLIVITGVHPQKNVICVNDPAFKTDKEVPHIYPLDEFLIAWERQMRLCYTTKKIDATQ
jgi:hypothetical protein